MTKIASTCSEISGQDSEEWQKVVFDKPRPQFDDDDTDMLENEDADDDVAVPLEEEAILRVAEEAEVAEELAQMAAGDVAHAAEKVDPFELVPSGSDDGRRSKVYKAKAVRFLTRAYGKKLSKDRLIRVQRGFLVSNRIVVTPAGAFTVTRGMFAVFAFDSGRPGPNRWDWKIGQIIMLSTNDKPVSYFWLQPEDGKDADYLAEFSNPPPRQPSTTLTIQRQIFKTWYPLKSSLVCFFKNLRFTAPPPPARGT